MESVFSKEVDEDIDFDAFVEAEQALEDEYGPVGIEQETRLDLLLAALTSTGNDIEDLKTKIEASTMFNSTITMPATTEYTGTTADSSQLTEGDETAMIQRLQLKIRELERKSYNQEQTIDMLQEQVNNTDAWKLKESGAEILLWVQVCPSHL